jgi:hypothetical protein
MATKDVKLIDKVTGGHAVHRRDTTTGQEWIDLHDEDWDTFYGALPVDTSVLAINNALNMIARAEQRGFEAGKQAKQNEVLAVLGVTDTVRALRAGITEEVGKLESEMTSRIGAADRLRY